MPLQDHLHLATNPADIVNELPQTIWTATDRLEVPVVFLGLKRSITGHLKTYAASSGGQVLQLTNFKYTVQVGPVDVYTLEDRIAQLKSLHGKVVYLVDNFHADDGQDHTADIRRMFMARVGEFPPLSPGLPKFYVDIELEDHTLQE